MCNALGFVGGRRVGEFDAVLHDGAKLRADDIGGKARAHQAAKEGGEFAFVERDAQFPDEALEARANESGFICLREGFFECGLDESIGDAACAKFPRDAIASLAARQGVAAGELSGVARIVEVLALLQPLENGPHLRNLEGAAFKILAHLMNRMRPARQRAQGSGVELLFG